MVLFTELFVDNKESNIKFIESNLSSNFFTKIVVFVDEKTESFVIHPKVIKIKKRLSSISQIFDFAKSFVKSDICVISNSNLSNLPIHFLGLDFKSKIYCFENEHYVFKTGQIEKFTNIINLDVSQSGPINLASTKKKNKTEPSNTITILPNKLDIIIVSVDYNDYLSITLKNNLKFVQNIHVVTSSKDLVCQEMCKKYGVDCIVTDRFYESNSIFNKGKAINYAISNLQNPDWILILDADILLKEKIDISNLDYNTLYSCKRTIIENHEQYLDLENQELFEESGIGFGYFQLFNFRSKYVNRRMVYPEVSRNASKSDVIFKRQFKLIQDLKFSVYHLGKTRLNWNGRKSEVFIGEDLKFDINNYFDKIYCINLDRRFDRWIKVSNDFKRLGINVKRFSAIDGLDINYGDDNFTIACLLSHIEVIKDAKKNNFKRVLIFEDDVIFEKDFLKKVEVIKNLNWKLLYLGSSQFSWSKILKSDSFYSCNKTLGSFAYAVDFTIYDDILCFLDDIHKPYDHHLVDLQKKHKDKSKVIYPNLVISTVNDSDIRESKSMSEYSKVVIWDLHNYQFNKTISIIIPCYGQSKYLNECIDSCLNQSILPNEIVILLMDDDSKGMRPDIENKSPIIKCFEWNRLDLSTARNFCVDQTTSEFFIPLDADDKLPINFLEKVSEHDADVVYVGSKYFGSIQGTWPDPIDEEVDWIKLTTFRRNSLVCTALIKKESFYGVGRYNQDLWAYEDMDLWIRMYRDGYKFIKCRETYLEYRKHNSSLIKKTNSNLSSSRLLKSIITKDSFYSRTPKIIHFVWLGDKPIPQHIIDNWKEKLPEHEWRYMMWNESNFDIESSEFLSKSYSQKKYGICVDYIRAHVLYEYGGVWLDMDCIINQDISCFLQYDFFSSWENKTYINIGLIGCSPKLQIFSNILEYYSNIKVNNSTFKNNQKFVNSVGTGPMVLTKEISKFYDIQIGGFTIEFNLQEKRFIIETPDVFVLDDTNSGRQNFAVHLFEGSWTDKKEEWSIVVKKQYEDWKIKNKIR